MSSCNKLNCCAEKINGAANCNCPRLKKDRALTWVDLAGLFPAPRECLAAFVAAVSAEVIAGVKPANLIRITHRNLPCGRCMLNLWRKYGQEILSSSPLSAMSMREERESDLLLFYDAGLLMKRFKSRTMQTFLRSNGYAPSLSLEQALQYLHSTFTDGVPDEVGMFLGYPLRDVKGFINQTTQPFQGGREMWRIYGPPARSLRLDQLYREKREEMTLRLTEANSPLALLRAA